MKKSALPILLAVSIFAFSLTPVFAENLPGGIQARLEQLRQNREKLQEIRQDIKSDVGLRNSVASGTAQLRQRAVDTIKTVFVAILSRFDAALLRLDNIASRMASRIDKLTARGINTSAAQAALLQAETAGANAKQAIDKAKADVGAIDSSSTTVRQAVQVAVNSVKAAKSALKVYQTALVSVLKDLKAAAGLKEGSTSAK